MPMTRERLAAFSDADKRTTYSSFYVSVLKAKDEPTKRKYEHLLRQLAEIFEFDMEKVAEIESETAATVAMIEEFIDSIVMEAA